MKQKEGVLKTLKSIRSVRRILQYDVSVKTGMTTQSISQIECCHRNPTLDTLIRYCDAIGVDLVEILRRELTSTEK